MKELSTNIREFIFSSSANPASQSARADSRVLRIKQDQKLWESEQLMEMFFSESIEGIWFMEAEEPFLWDDSVDKEKALDYAFEHQHIVRVNNAMLEQYEAKLEDFIGLNLNDFFAHDLQKARRMWKQIFDKGKLTCETKEHKFRGSEKFAGDPVWFLGDYFCIYNSEGKMVGHFGAQRDITARKLAEQGLKESEERYRFIAKHMADGILLAQEDRIQLANEALVTMFGYSDFRQLVGKDIFSLISKESREQLKSFIQELKVVDDKKGGFRGGSKIYQGLFLTREGRKFWAESKFAPVNWSGQPALLCTIRDVNERKLKEIAAQEKASELYRENIKLRGSIKERYRFRNIIGKSPGMQKVYELIIRAASSDANVMIYGESGTGKELVAHAIHDLSHRSEKPFVTVNCNAIPESLLESEFFGHRKGAFTGAYIDKKGFLERANGGEVFLDEVGDLGLSLQGKLLRAIEGGEYSPVGSNEVCYSNFRIIAATNKDMGRAVRNGTMREDFYYRIHIIPITLPPLRERKEDIPLLIDYFLAAMETDHSSRTIPGKVLEALYNYDWPGNVRELKNAIHQYMAVGRLDFMALSQIQEPAQGPFLNPKGGPIQPGFDFRTKVEAFERDLIVKALNQTRCNRNRSCQVLGIPRRTLYHKMKKYGLI